MGEMLERLSQKAPKPLIPIKNSMLSSSRWTAPRMCHIESSMITAVLCTHLWMLIKNFNIIMFKWSILFKPAKGSTCTYQSRLWHSCVFMFRFCSFRRFWWVFLEGGYMNVDKFFLFLYISLLACRTLYW